MSRVAYVDGQYLPHRSARVHMEDRGYQFADGVYKVNDVLGKQLAEEAAVFEAWQIDREGKASEGTSTNAWIATSDATVVTRQADSAILNGVTRLAVLDIIRREGYVFVEREAFLTSTVVALLPVLRIDGAAVGDGKLRETYLTHAASTK
jgi:D-alanine transaminase